MARGKNNGPGKGKGKGRVEEKDDNGWGGDTWAGGNGDGGGGDDEVDEWGGLDGLAGMGDWDVPDGPAASPVAPPAPPPPTTQMKSNPRGGKQANIPGFTFQQAANPPSFGFQAAPPPPNQYQSGPSGPQASAYASKAPAGFWAGGAGNKPGMPISIGVGTGGGMGMGMGMGAPGGAYQGAMGGNPNAAYQTMSPPNAFPKSKFMEEQPPPVVALGGWPMEGFGGLGGLGAGDDNDDGPRGRGGNANKQGPAGKEKQNKKGKGKQNQENAWEQNVNDTWGDNSNNMWPNESKVQWGGATTYDNEQPDDSQWDNDPRQRGQQGGKGGKGKGKKKGKKNQDQDDEEQLWRGKENVDKAGGDWNDPYPADDDWAAEPATDLDWAGGGGGSWDKPYPPSPPAAKASSRDFGSAILLDGGVDRKQGTAMRIEESGGKGLEPARQAMYGSHRVAEGRFMWILPYQHDPRVIWMNDFVQRFNYALASLGFHKYLNSREKGALLVNVDYFSDKRPSEPAFDWVSFSEMQKTRDRTIQQSIAANNPAKTCLVFIFLVSKSGSSVGMWRRKLPVPQTLQTSYKAQIRAVESELRDKVYIVKVDPPLPPMRPSMGMHAPAVVPVIVTAPKKEKFSLSKWITWGKTENKVRKKPPRA